MNVVVKTHTHTHTHTQHAGTYAVTDKPLEESGCWDFDCVYVKECQPLLHSSPLVFSRYMIKTHPIVQECSTVLWENNHWVGVKK
jgi:hypothetical protein